MIGMSIDEMGTSVVVTATAADGVPLTGLEDLAREWYDQRHAWKSRLSDWPTILARLESMNKDGSWILNDAADATAGGSPGHSAEALRRLLPLKDDLPGKVLLWIVDPDTVQAARDGATHFYHGRSRGGMGGTRPVDGRGQLPHAGQGLYRAAVLDGRGRGDRGRAAAIGGLLLSRVDARPGVL